MDQLIRQVTVIDRNSSHHRQKVDILIRDGRITSIGPELKAPAGAEVFSAKGAYVSAGWIDTGAQVGDPGYEHREDLQSAAAAAAAGGFTGIGCLPNTNPVVDTKSEVLYLRNHDRHLLVDLYPIGALSHGCQGKEITEMIDMHTAGAVAFSDGNRPVQNGGLMMRALQYVTAFGGVVANQPQDLTVAADGQMHEGMLSTSLGLKGLPPLAEELMVQRDIYLLEYTNSRLHLANLSTAQAVELVRQAKARGLRLTCSVPALNLVYDQSALEDFDTNFKVLPPLRSKKDVKALREGVLDGTIDMISANHVPLEEEVKKLEFPFAEFGAIGLETAFPLAWSALGSTISLEELIDRLAVRPRQLFGLPDPEIEEGVPANLTVFDPERSWTLTEADLRSKSANCPLLGQTLKGRVLAVFNRGRSEVFERR